MSRLVQFLAGLLALHLGIASAASAEGQAGAFDYYTLVLSWSPTYCAEQGRSRPYEPQCAAKRPFAFILHGLWPQYEKGWPENCRAGRRPWVPNDVIRDMLDIMPSKRLIIHEYRTHGVCSGLDPEDYFRVSRQAFDAIKIPALFKDLQDYLTISPEEIERQFLNANPELRPEMINIDCKHRRLQELRVCFTRELRFKACGVNEHQGRLCSEKQIVMPPVRAAAWR